VVLRPLGEGERVPLQDGVQLALFTLMLRRKNWGGGGGSGAIDSAQLDLANT